MNNEIHKHFLQRLFVRDTKTKNTEIEVLSTRFSFAPGTNDEHQKPTTVLKLYYKHRISRIRPGIQLTRVE